MKYGPKKKLKMRPFEIDTRRAETGGKRYSLTLISGGSMEDYYKAGTLNARQVKKMRKEDRQARKDANQRVRSKVKQNLKHYHNA